MNPVGVTRAEQSAANIPQKLRDVFLVCVNEVSTDVCAPMLCRDEHQEKASRSDG